MLLRSHIRLHLPWIILSVVLLLIGVIWHAVASQTAGRTVGGSSLVGLVIGTIAAAIILFELLLWPRKWMRRLRLGPARYWMAGHIWLGLVCGPLAWVHSGYRMGGALSSLLMWLLIAVIVSGLVGWLIQNLLPRWMLKNLPAETITSQIPYVSEQAAKDARRMLRTACGPSPEESNRVEVKDELIEENKEVIVIGALRNRGGIQGKTLRTETFEVPKRDWNPLWKNFADIIEPYLIGGSTSHNPLHQTGSSQKWFDSLRNVCLPESSKLIDRLQDLADQRRQFDAQKKAQRTLHTWIPWHAGISILLGIVLVIHIIQGLRYL